MKMSPLDRQAFVEKQILRLCNRFGFTTESISTTLLGTTRRDYCNRLAKRGLLRLGKEYDDRPSYYLLTKAGYEIAQGCEQFPLEHISDSHKVTRNLFWHEHMLAEVTAYHLQKSAVSDYLIPRRQMTEAKKYCECKLFDAIYFKDAGDRGRLSSIGVEIENQDWKRGDRLENFIQQISRSLRGDLVGQVLIFCNTEGKRDFYQRCFRNSLKLPSVEERIKIHTWLGEVHEYH